MQALTARLRAYHSNNPQIWQTLVALGIKGFGAVLSFALSWQVARAFGASGVGQFGLAVSTLTIASTLTLVGLDYILIRTVAGDMHSGRRDLARGAVRSATVFVGVGAALMAVFLLAGGIPLLTAVTGAREDTTVLRWAAIVVVPLALTRVMSSALRGSGKVLTAQAIDGTLSTGISCVLLAVLGVLGLARQVTVLALVYGTGITLAVALGWAFYGRSVRAWPPPARVPVLPMLRSGWRILIVVLTGFFTDWYVLVSLAAHFSTVEVGQYRTAWQFANIFTVIITAFDAVAGPRIATAHRAGDTARIYAMWRQAIAIMLFLSVPLLLLALISPGSLLGLFGHQFTPAAPALRVLALGQLINIVTGPVGAVLIMTGRDRWSLVNALGGVVVLVASSLWLIPRYGPLGAAWATAAALAFRKLSGAGIAYVTLQRERTRT